MQHAMRDYMHARDDRTNFKFSIFLELLIVEGPVSWKAKMACAQQLDVRTPASSSRCPDISRPTH